MLFSIPDKPPCGVSEYLLLFCDTLSLLFSLLELVVVFDDVAFVVLVLFVPLLFSLELVSSVLLVV